MGLGLAAGLAAEPEMHRGHKTVHEVVWVSAMGIQPARGEVIDRVLLYYHGLYRGGFFHDPVT